MGRTKKLQSAKWRQHLRIWWQRRWVRWLTYVLVSFGVVIGLIFCLNIFVFKPVANPVYGVSFSLIQTKNLGLDWKSNYTALLDDMQFKHFRLMSYWNYIEPQRGHFDFDDLDWQFNEANKRGAKISLALGVRQPRWPECHQPDWAQKLSGGDWEQALDAYTKVVVDRYKNNPALESYQLENEALNNWFGTCDAPDRQRVIAEYNLVKQWDPDHPVIMSLSDEHGLPLGQPVPDQYGFSLYRMVWNDKIPPNGYMIYPAPVWWHRLRAAVIESIQHKPIIIHELQLEPWGPTNVKDLSITEQNISMSAQQIKDNIYFARQTGIRQMYLWGGEWWYWRKVNGDPTIWDTVKDQLQTQR